MAGHETTAQALSWTFPRDRQIEMPHQGQDRVVALATMDSAYATVAALSAEGSTCCHLLPHHPHSRHHPARRQCRRPLAAHRHARARGYRVL
jgi:hypothetical protein